MEDKKNQLVIVLSRNYSTGLSVIRSLGAAGYAVDLVASGPKAGSSAVAAASKYVNCAVEVVSKKVKDGEDKELLDELLKYIDKYEQKPVLFPTDDYTASVMDINRSILKEHFLMPTIDGGLSLPEYMDKTVQSQVARSVGLPTPLEWAINLNQILIPEDMVYPCYCKPIASILGYKTEMATCNNEKELLDHLYKLRENFADRYILVQEFLEIDTEIDLSGVSLDQEVIIPAVTRKNKIGKYERGVVISGTIIPFDTLGDVQQKVVNMLKAFHYTGMFHMDLNLVGDKIYFGEINLRSGGPNYIYYESGVNLPEIFVKELLGERHAPEEEVVNEFGKTFVYEKIAWDEYLHGLMTREELDKCISEADITLLFNDDDPAPGQMFAEKMEKAADKKELKDGCIAEAMETAGWEREYAEEQIRDSRKRLGISYKDYRKHNFCLIPPDEQEEKYKEIVDRRERIKRQREECIVSAMEMAGWEREYAVEQIKDARERLGISYKDYRQHNFCIIPPKKQAKMYEKILRQRQQKKKK